MRDPEHFFLGYPPILRDWAAEISLPPPPDVDCTRCPFAAPACCAFDPKVPNFLVGRELSLEGIGRDRMSTRIASGRGLSALGLEATQRMETTCDFWQAGCTIWSSRGATCRTYFCDGAPAARQTWLDLNPALSRAERNLARYCLAQGEPPATDTDAQGWHAWFRWCWETAASLSPGAIDLDRLEAGVPLLTDRRRLPLPEILTPSAPPFERIGDDVHFQVASPWARSVYPTSVFGIFARLDGQTLWRDLEVDVEVIDALFRAGVLSEPD